MSAGEGQTPNGNMALLPEGDPTTEVQGFLTQSGEPSKCANLMRTMRKQPLFVRLFYDIFVGALSSSTVRGSYDLPSVSWRT